MIRVTLIDSEGNEVTVTMPEVPRDEDRVFFGYENGWLVVHGWPEWVFDERTGVLGAVHVTVQGVIPDGVPLVDRRQPSP